MSLPLFLIRRGLPETGRKLAGGKALTIAYLGGSITEARPDGYAWQTTIALRQLYPNSAITEINAGIGGTGSDFGAFRLRQDVLRHRPDLLLLEFAVNDSGEGHDLRAAMEGIVRSTQRELPGCEIAFVYTLAKGLVPELKEGCLPRGARQHEPVAEHYQLLSVNVAVDVVRRLSAGGMTWSDFANDDAHPNKHGHSLYTDTIIAALKEAFAAAPSPTHLPKPFTDDPWEDADLVPVSPDARFPGWSYRPLVNRGGWECFDGLLESDTPGSEAAFEFRGRVIGIVYQLGPESGDLLWAIDDGELQSARLFDDYAPSFWRPSYRILAGELKPGPHRLRLRVGFDRDPRSKGTWTKLAGLLTR